MTDRLLTHSPAEVIQWLIVALDLGSDPDPANDALVGDWPVYFDSEPSNPDNCLTVYDTTGQNDGRTMIDGELLQHYGIQVRIRATDARTGWTKAQGIRKTLSENDVQRTVHVVADGVDAVYTLWNLARFGTVLRLGKDVSKTKRSLFTINFLASLRQEST